MCRVCASGADATHGNDTNTRVRLRDGLHGCRRYFACDIRCQWIGNRSPHQTAWAESEDRRAIQGPSDGEPLPCRSRPITMSVMNVKAAAIAAVAALALSGCTSHHNIAAPKPIPTTSSPVALTGPERDCSRAGLRHVISATTTTVGEIRELREGPGGQPYRDFFSTLAPSHPATWCWTEEAPQEYVAHAVAAGKALTGGTMGGLSQPPSGAPMFP
jgi:hypothetical protein